MHVIVTRDRLCSVTMNRSIFLVLFSLLGFVTCQEQFEYSDECIKVSFMIEADIMYKTKNGSTQTVAVMGQNFSSDVISTCDEETATLDFTWMNDFYTVTLDFTADLNESWSLHSILFEYYTEGNQAFKDPAVTEEYLETNETSINKIKWGNSYKCANGVTFTLDSEISDNKVDLKLKDLQIQVFSFLDNLGAVTDCAHKPTPPPPHRNSTTTFDQTVYYNGTSTPCIRVKMKLNSTTIHYLTTAGKPMDISLPLMKADNFTVTNHYCIMKGSSRHSNITIGWPTDSPCYSLAILFSADFTKGSQGWDIDQLQFHYNTSCNPDFDSPAESNVTLFNNEEFTDDSIALSRSFKCDEKKYYHFKSKKHSKSTANLTMTVLQLQAFLFSGNDRFGSDVSCEGNKTPAIVPVVVGIALGVFVTAVVVAYVIGRIQQHKKKKSGYERL